MKGNVWDLYRSHSSQVKEVMMLWTCGLDEGNKTGTESSWKVAIWKAE
jgi:hypothetical protein